MVEMEEGLEPGELRQSSPAEGEENEEGDRVSIEKLKLLGCSATLKGMLANPYLRQLLQEINHSSNPQKALQKAMNIPVFVEFTDECLRACETGKNN